MSEWDAFPTAPPAATADPWDAFPAVKAAPVSRGEAAKEGFLSGASAGFRDEIYGLSKTSALPDWMGGLRAIPGAAELIMEKARNLVRPGESPIQAQYETARDAKRQEVKQAEQQYPGTFVAGQVGGALTAPVGGIMQGASMLGRMGRSAAVGAGYGALTGAGEADTMGDVLPKAAAGGAIGAGAGAVATPLVEGAIQAGRAIAAPLVRGLRGAVNPETEAARRVTGAIERDIAADPAAATRLTPQEFTQTARQGGPATIMDMGGETTRALARSAANTSTEGRAALQATTGDRFETQSGRVSDWLRQTFNYPNPQATQDALEQTARTVNRGAYARAYRDGDAGVWSPELERLTGSPAVVDAMRGAATRGKDRAITEGFGGFNPGVTFDQTGMMTFQRGPTGQPTYPTLQYWDQVKRNLDSAVGVAQRSGDNSRAQELTGIRTALVRELDTAVPSYQQARAGAAHFFGAENALEAGQNFVGASKQFGIPEARAAIGRMSPTERQLFQDGYVDRFVQTLDKTNDRRNILNKIAESPAAREELRVALGPHRATELEALLRIEGVMDHARIAVSGNSTTLRQQVERGLAGGSLGIGGMGTYNMDPTQITTAALVGALAAGSRHIDQRLARHVAELLVSNDPRRLQQGVQIVARSQNLLNALRTTDARLARAGTEQAPLPTLQAPGTGRADEN